MDIQKLLDLFWQSFEAEAGTQFMRGTFHDVNSIIEIAKLQMDQIEDWSYIKLFSRRI